MAAQRDAEGRSGLNPRTARKELDRVRQGLERIESLLVTMESGGSGATTRARPERYHRLLVDVYERGRHGVDAESFAALGRARGYDARGLGGFFVGSRAPLRRAQGRVSLTREGYRLLDEYLRGPQS